jgi:DNA-directed RNA polymerase specialized sigma24 family protein
MDVLMAAYKLSTKGNPPRNMWTFLKQSARNRVIDDHRHRQVVQICNVTDDVYFSVPADSSTTDPSVLCETQERVEYEQRTIRRMLRRVREKEPSGYQVLLMQLDGHSLADIGTLLSMKSSAVDRRLRAVRDLILPAEHSRRIF